MRVRTPTSREPCIPEDIGPALARSGPSRSSAPPAWPACQSALHHSGYANWQNSVTQNGLLYFVSRSSWPSQPIVVPVEGEIVDLRITVCYLQPHTQRKKHQATRPDRCRPRSAPAAGLHSSSLAQRILDSGLSSDRLVLRPQCSSLLRRHIRLPHLARFIQNQHVLDCGFAFRYATILMGIEFPFHSMG